MSREMKIEAARAALELVKPGMKIGIGTGSTADEFVRLLADKVTGGFEIIGVPTSERTAALCVELGVPLTTLDQVPALDMTIDGADEVDPQLRLIKGAGGALLREKIVATASKEMIVIADSTKLVDVLGAFALPIEVNPFGLEATRIAVEALAREQGLEGPIELRMDNEHIYITDGGHYILDASFGRIVDAEALSAGLLNIPGVVQHGLFLQIATKAFIAGAEGVQIVGK